MDGASLDFPRITKRINLEATHLAFDRIEFIPEHDALSWRFNGALVAMAKVGQRKMAEREGAEAKNAKEASLVERNKRDYEAELRKYNKRWISWLWTSTPTPPREGDFVPVPTVEEWHRQLVALGVDSGLSDLLVMDAGGFSLDVFWRGAGIPTGGLSLEAGGRSITEAVVNKIPKFNGGRISFHEAEERKIEACMGKGAIIFRDVIKQATLDTYEAPLTLILDKITPLFRNRMVPLILSGGASQNEQLISLIKKLFPANIPTTKTPGFIFLSTPELAEIINNDSQLQHINILERYNLTAREFAGNDSEARPRFDVAAGLLESWILRRDKSL
jgi:hypothetical protein